MPLHCPKCGAVLKTKSGTLYCDRGDMHFSPTLESAYRKHFDEKRERAPDVRWKCKVGGAWFCPKCGGPMRETEGRIWCDACEVNLGAFVYHLIEHHPHRSESGACI
jgi:uncharacterized Zn finger protein (UPF0148 family)